MNDPPLNPQRAYEALAEALRLFYAQPPTDQALKVMQDAVSHATEIWQRCEVQRVTSTKEFRAHVVRLKLLLAGVPRTLDLLLDMSCQTTSPSYPEVGPLCDMSNTEESTGVPESPVRSSLPRERIAPSGAPEHRSREV